jgi:shikimate dehydrogenase
VTTTPGRLVLLGHPLGHSLSPVFQNAALVAAGIPLTYEAVDVPRSVLDETMTELRRAHAAGNVTIPYKESVMAACDRLTETARAVGAVNTFWTAVDGALVGDNTDVGGFSAAVQQLLETNEPPRGQTIALLGAGGAARAVMHAIEGWPDATVRVYSRTQIRAEELVKRYKVQAEVVRSAPIAVEGATLVINATPVGLRDDTSPVEAHALPKTSAVLDLAYRIGETALVRDARGRGLRAMDGLTMLVEQGALAFERWFGTLPDRNVMWEALRPKR